MLHFLAANWGTILVALSLATVLALILWRMGRARKQGKSASCGCGCSGCPASSACHGQKE